MSLDESITTWLSSVEAVWNANDGNAFGELFTGDGSLINPFGERADGSDTVASMYTTYFAGMLSGTTSAITLHSARAVGTDHAFIDAMQQISASDGTVLLSLHLAAVLQRSGNGWRFLDSRPYGYLDPPA